MFYSSREKYLIIYFSLIFILCYLIFLLFIELKNFQNLKKILNSFDVKKLEFDKNLRVDKYDNIYNNNNPKYLSKQWYSII